MKHARRLNIKAQIQIYVNPVKVSYFLTIPVNSSILFFLGRDDFLRKSWINWQEELGCTDKITGNGQKPLEVFD